jgi:hypothetical protein
MLTIKKEIMDKDNLVEDGQWDFYSGLPNPSWYDNSDDQSEGDEG